MQDMRAYVANTLENLCETFFLNWNATRISCLHYYIYYCLERNIYYQQLTESKTQPISFLSSSIFLRRTC